MAKLTRLILKRRRATWRGSCLYTLTPARDVNLKTHIGQTASAEIVARTLNVTTVKTVAADCRQLK